MKRYIRIFPIRLKAVRQAYGLSLAEIASILDVNARSTLFDWENNKKFPSVENLDSISTVFGISFDWLLGHSNILYTEDSVKFSEKAVDDEIRYISLTEYPNPSEAFSWNMLLWENFREYFEWESRKEYYSLPVRANIAVLMRMIKLPSFYWAMYARDGYKKKGIIAKVKELLHIPEEIVLKSPSPKELDRSDNLGKLLQLDTVHNERVKKEIPVYDVEAAYKQLKQEIFVM